MTQTNLVNRYLSIEKCVRDAGGSRFRGNDRVWLGTGDSSLRWNRNAETYNRKYDFARLYSSAL